MCTCTGFVICCSGCLLILSGMYKGRPRTGPIVRTGYCGRIRIVLVSVAIGGGIAGDYFCINLGICWC